MTLIRRRPVDRLSGTMRIVLFDIDGTILTTGNGGREAFARALSEAAGRPIVPDGYAFVGRTDPQIARDILAGHGVEGDELENAIPTTIRLYLRYFEQVMPRLRTARLLPGVQDLLEALAACSGVHVALLTGNVLQGARLKLDLFGLTHFFNFALSCFGSDDADRYRLPPLAIERARNALEIDVRPADLVLVGDSEHDVLCARAVGARSVAVGTGWTSIQVLRALRPDVLLKDLSDTDIVVKVILNGGETASN